MLCARHAAAVNALAMHRWSWYLSHVSRVAPHGLDADVTELLRTTVP